MPATGLVPLQTVRVCATCAAEADETARFCPECGGGLSDPAVVATSAPRSADSIGAEISGQFEIEAELGGGAFAKVYRGRQRGLDRRVALKIPTHEIAADPIMAKRFAREARSAARVDHPSVVAIYAVGELDDGRPYIAMQLVDGRPLGTILADGPLDPARALGITRQIASALSETHAAEVVHRDLKPSNIIWKRDRNGDDRIVIVDFGIAVCKPGNPDATRLTSGNLIGTPHYMSPEQAHGEQVDARADLYAVGCILFELVTGETPFEGSGVEVMLAHLGKPAPKPSDRNKTVPRAIDRVVGLLLAKKAEDRPASADELVALIDDARAELDGLRPPRTTTPRLKRATISTHLDLPETSPRVRRRRRRWLWPIAAIIALAGTAVGAFVLGRDKPGADGAALADEPEDSPTSPVDPNGPNRREIVRDDGEIVMRALVPDPIAARHDIGVHLVLANKLGQPVAADSIVVTIEDPRGETRGITARPHGHDAGHFGFHHVFPSAGHYVVRVFPPSVDSAFEIDLDIL